tara:strand:+ start:21802 stop:23916 length:2115 start_codon:yes stop_codon:yes gene_type:complete
MKLPILLLLKTALFPLLFFAFLSSAQNSADNPRWINPKGQERVAFKNQTMEIGFYLNEKIQQKINEFSKDGKNGTNPYDPEQINFTTIFTSPSGKTHKKYGFYYLEYSEDLAKNLFVKKQTKYPWRVRFAADEVGEWKMNAIVTGNGVNEKSIFDMTFTCQNSSHKGPLTTTKTGTDADRYLSYAQTGDFFNPISLNISNCGPFSYLPSENYDHLNAIQKHADESGNFTRIEIGAQNGLPDWQDMRNYNEKQDEMFGLDRVFQKAEDNKMYYIIFRHHVEIVGPGWGVSNWNNNPYRKALNLESLRGYYENPEAIKWQKNNLRYMYARWGYSPYWSFYGYSELEHFYKGMIEQEGISEKEAIKIMLNWFLDQKKYILEELKPNELFSNSYGRLTKLESKAKFNGFFSNSDVVALHMYSTVKKANYERRYDDVEYFWDTYKKPIIIEEMGINDDKLPIMCCTKIEFHNSIWSTAFMGDFGTGLDWWFDRGILALDQNRDMTPLYEFVKDEDYIKEKYAPQKWADAKDNKRMIESFQLKNEKKDRIIGWLHNASYYWRNEAVNSTCLQGLLDSSNLENPCVVGEGIALGRNDSPRDYAREFHEDKYTSKGGFQPIQSKGGIEDNPIFKVENVNFSRGRNKHWYKVEFFSTQVGKALEPIAGSTQIVRANFFKDLVIHVPNLDNSHPDVAFRVSYLGRSKKAESLTR